MSVPRPYLPHDVLEDFPDRQGRGSLLIVAHHDPARIYGVLEDAAGDRGWPLLALGLPLSEHLASVPSRSWDRATDAFVADWVRTHGPGPVVIVRIDLLFEPSMKIDTVALLTGAGRLCPLIVGWPGEWDGRTLSYATPGHRHYRTWTRPSAEVRQLA